MVDTGKSSDNILFLDGRDKPKFWLRERKERREEEIEDIGGSGAPITSKLSLTLRNSGQKLSSSC